MKIEGEVDIAQLHVLEIGFGVYYKLTGWTKINKLQPVL